MGQKCPNTLQIASAYIINSFKTFTPLGHVTSGYCYAASVSGVITMVILLTFLWGLW
jgi:hypothetical protein